MFREVPRIVRAAGRALAPSSRLSAASSVSAQSATGGFVVTAGDSGVRAPITAAQAQAFLPQRGIFTFPAPWDSWHPRHQRQRLQWRRLRRLRLLLLEQDQQPRGQRHDADRRRPQSKPRRQRPDAVHLQQDHRRAMPDRSSTPTAPSLLDCRAVVGLSKTRPSILYVEYRSAASAVRRPEQNIRNGVRRDQPSRRRQVSVADALERR